MDIRITPSQLKGTIPAISSKSDAHRILIASALANKETVIHCNSTSKDIKATINCLNALGADISADEKKITVNPIIKANEKAELDCGESGSTLRFLLPVASALSVNATFKGDGRLPSRPVTPLRREMETNGVTFSPPWVFPIETSGTLQAGEYMVKGNISSQFVTGLLFALPLLDGDSTLRLIPPVESRSYIDMTLDTLKKFSIEITEKDNEFFIKGNQKYISPGEITVDGDWSNAAFFLVAGAIGGEVTVSGLNINSLQGDRKIVDLLKQMGAEVKVDNDKITVLPGELKGIEIDAGDIPDLIPVLSVAASNAKTGVTTVVNAGRLRLKECDRLAAINECINNIGIIIAETDDGLVIWSGEKIRGGDVFSFNDHRIVMSMAIAAITAENEIVIREAEAVEKSYPKFFEDFRKLGGKADVINNQGE